MQDVVIFYQKFPLLLLYKYETYLGQKFIAFKQMNK